MALWKNIESIAEDFISLFYPKLCLICKENLLKTEECICISCLYQTPRTDCFTSKENGVSKRFCGKVKFKNTVALFAFNKEGNA